MNILSSLGPLLLAAPLAAISPQASEAAPDGLDARVKTFLDRTRDQWHDLNVPYEDGQALHDLVVKNGFKRGLEIGTSTGLSAVWIGWAMSKTSGRLITIEIDEGRHLVAKKNLEEAGVAAYPQYFKDLDPKVQAGGCFTAHNVRNGFGGVEAFLDLVRSRPDYRTEILRTSRSGISVSCKRR